MVDGMDVNKRSVLSKSDLSIVLDLRQFSTFMITVGYNELFGRNRQPIEYQSLKQVLTLKCWLRDR